MSRAARWALRIAVAVLAVLGLALTLQAGVGGGHSFGGGGNGGGGGGGGEGIGELIRLLLYLAIEVPAIGIPLLILAIAWYIYSQRAGATRDQASWRRRRGVRGHRGSADVTALQEVDPTFSRLLFLDFVRLLYVRYQEARGSGDQASIRAYLDDGLIEGEAAARTQVSEVVVGSAELQGVQLGPRHTQVTVRVRANVTETGSDGKSERFVLQQTLSFVRDAGVRSPAPEQLLELGCPSCGSKEQTSAAGRCGHCGEVVSNGKFGWFLKGVMTVTRERLASVESLTYHHPRQGPPPPTLFAPDFDAMRRKFQVQHPDFRWSDFSARADEVFRRLNEAWTSKDWAKARPYETDALFDRHRFWIDRYRAAGLTNVVKDIEIQQVEPCRLEQDAFLEAITVRIHARMLDYTIRDADSEVLGGSATRPREFSEYWTFVRRIGVVGGAPDLDHCPSCAAPLKISQAGVCDYCNRLVTSGEFGWVLAAIDQEEAYGG